MCIIQGDTRRVERSTTLKKAGDPKRALICIGIGYEFVTFPSTLISFDLEGGTALSIFNEAGLESKIEVSFQVYIDEEYIIETHQKYRTAYGKTLTAQATEALKNIGPSFTIDQYVGNRTQVASEMASAVDEKVNAIHFWVPLGKGATRVHSILFHVYNTYVYDA